jgi:uncharacterized membrane protein
MKNLFLIIFNALVNAYSLLYLGLFLTDYSFILKKGLSNIAAPTAGLVVLLSLSRFFNRDGFTRLYLPRLLRSILALPEKVVLVFLFIAVTAVISGLGIARHLSFSTMAWDMGIFDQAIWNTLHGDILFSSIRGNFSLAGDHFEPILFFMVPFYQIFPHVFTLIIVQAVILGASVFPLYLLAKERLQTSILAFSFVLSFILSKGLRGVGLSDFHPEAFMVLFSFWAFYFLIKKKNILFALAIVLLLFCKESAVFILLGLGVFAFIGLKRRLAGFLVLLSAVFAWCLETRILLPAFNPSGNYLFMVRMPFGDTYQENLAFVITKPLKFISFIFMPRKIIYLFKLLGQAGFLPIFSPVHCLLMFFPLLTVILSTEGHFGYYLLSTHYIGHILPFVYIAGVCGAGRLIDKLRLSEKGRVYLAVYLVLVSLFAYGKTDAYKFAKFMKGMNKHQCIEKARYLALIPKSASVSAVSNLIPQLSHRKYIYDWEPDSPVSLATDYVVIDLDFLEYLPPEFRVKAPLFIQKAQEKGYKNVFVNKEETFFILHNPDNDNSYIRNFKGNLGI